MAKSSKIMFSSEQLEEITTIQEIPNLFMGLKLSGSEAIRQALMVAKHLNLIPAKSPLRTIWYAFVKKSIENNGIVIKKGDKAFYEVFAKMIKSGDYYSQYNIENSGIVYSKPYGSKGFGDSWLTLEKESYFSVFKNLKNLLGVGVYAGGGQPSQSGTEYIMNQYWSMPEKINLFSITDFDPSGLNISNTFFDQFSMYSHRKGGEVDMKRVGTSPEYYTSDELDQAKYLVKSSTQKRWIATTLQMRQRLEKEGDIEGLMIIDRTIKNNMKLWEDQWGLEVESLPANPTPIFDNLFPGFELQSWEGQARIRLIVFKQLLDTFGIHGYMEDYLNDCFNNDTKASNIIDEKSDICDFEEITSNISSLCSDLDSVMNDMFNSEKETLTEQLNDWSEEFISDKLEDSEYEHRFTQKLLNSVAKDSSSCYSTNFYSEIPEELLEFEISDEKKEKLTKYQESLNEIKEQLQALYNEIEEDINSDDDDEEDEDGSEDSDEDEKPDCETFGMHSIDDNGYCSSCGEKIEEPAEDEDESEELVSDEIQFNDEDEGYSYSNVSVLVKDEEESMFDFESWEDERDYGKITTTLNFNALSDYDEFKLLLTQFNYSIMKFMRKKLLECRLDGNKWTIGNTALYYKDEMTQINVIFYITKKPEGL